MLTTLTRHFQKKRNKSRFCCCRAAVVFAVIVVVVAVIIVIVLFIPHVVKSPGLKTKKAKIKMLDGHIIIISRAAR